MILSELDLINVARTRIPDINTTGQSCMVSVMLDRDTQHWLGTKQKFANLTFEKDTKDGVLQWSYVGYSFANQKGVGTVVNMPTMAILYTEWRRGGYDGSLVEFLEGLNGKNATNYIRRYSVVENVCYIGKAIEGSQENENVWIITKIQINSLGGTIVSVLSNVAWNDFLTLNYV